MSRPDVCVVIALDGCPQPVKKIRHKGTKAQRHKETMSLSLCESELLLFSYTMRLIIYTHSLLLKNHLFLKIINTVSIPFVRDGRNHF